MRPVRIAGAILVITVFGACSSDSKVGQGIDINRLNAKANRLGELNVPKNKGTGGFVGQQEQKQQQQQQAATAGGQSSRQAQQAAAAQQQKQLEQSAVAFRITSSGYDPYYLRVFKGGSIKVTNADSQARTVTADRGEFDSGNIAPGDTWVYQANTIGKFNFHDGTRPFVVGTLEVLAK